MALKGNESQKAREASFRLLAVRARSTAELEQRLKQKGFLPETISTTLGDLKAKGYLDDGQFARQFIREKFENSGWGPARLRPELARKGIDKGLTEEIMGAFFEDRDLVAEVLPLARKRWRAWSGRPAEVRRRRLTGFLQRRGYDWDVIGRVLEQLDQGRSAD